MASQVFITPGSYSREFDQTFISPSIVQDNIFCLAGFTPKGRAFEPIKVNSYSTYYQEFGGKNQNYTLPYAAAAILNNDTSVLITRILGTDNATTQNSYVPLLFAKATTAATVAVMTNAKMLAVLRTRDTTTGSMAVGWTGSPSAFTLSISACGLSGADNSFSGSASGSVTGLSLDPTSPNYIVKKLGTDPTTPKAGDQLACLYVDRVFSWYMDTVVGDNTTYNETDYNGALTAVTTVVMAAASLISTAAEITFGAYTNAFTPYIVSQNYNNVVFDLFRFNVHADGNSSNQTVKMSITNVVVGDSTTPTKFTVLVRDINDTDSKPVVLETFKDVTLSATDKNYIKRVIGDMYNTFNTTTGEIIPNGEFKNNSKYVAIQMATNIPVDAVPSGFRSVEYLINAVASKITPHVPMKVDQLLNGVWSDNSFIGPKFDTYSTKLYNVFNSLPTNAAGKTTQMGVMIVDSTLSESAASASLSSSFSLITMSAAGNTRKKQFTVPFYGGWDGYKSTIALSAQQTSLSSSVIAAINILSDRDTFDFDVFATPGINLKALNTLSLAMIENRGDALFVVDEGVQTTAKTSITGTSFYGSYDSSYATGSYPWGRGYDDENDINVWLPPSIAVLEAFAFNDKIAYPWNAAAGINRGQISSFEDLYTNLTQTDKISLDQAHVNYLVKYKGAVVRFSQNTLQRKTSALSKENVRRLLIKIRKVITAIGMKYVQEPNVPRTWDKFLAEVNPYLEDVQKKQGITLFKIIMDESTNTPDKIDRNEMYAKIALQPTRSAEIFVIDFILTPTGASFDNI